MLMNTINKFEQPNTEQADRRCAFSRSFTRMFDRLCAFLDERIGGASELIDACQSVADRFWHSKLYFPVCFLMLAVFMAVGQPVIGGVLFAIFTCICYVTGVAEFAFDDTLKEVCMVMFFTSVGFQANLKVLKSGGKAMIVFLGVVIVLIVSQNFLAVGLANLLGVDPLVGLCTGSIPMVGGHGTAGAFGPVLEDFGIQGATTLCTAAATYGLIAGSMMGGPIGKMLIERHNLLATVVPEDDSLLVEEEIKHERHSSMYPAASFQLIIAMGIGTVLSKLLSLTGMTFPIYIGAMIAAACIRNLGEYGGIQKSQLHPTTNT